MTSFVSDDLGMKSKEIKEKYSVKVKCRNCTYGSIYEEFLEIEKGVQSDMAVKITVCPVCGCYTLTKL